MTPSEIRDMLGNIQAQVRDLEDHLEHQKDANPLYHLIRHEIVEAWEALERAAELTDEVGVGN